MNSPRGSMIGTSTFLGHQRYGHTYRDSFEWHVGREAAAGGALIRIGAASVYPLLRSLDSVGNYSSRCQTAACLWAIGDERTIQLLSPRPRRDHGLVPRSLAVVSRAGAGVRRDCCEQECWRRATAARILKRLATRLHWETQRGRSGKNDVIRTRGMLPCSDVEGDACRFWVSTEESGSHGSDADAGIVLKDKRSRRAPRTDRHPSHASLGPRERVDGTDV